MKDELLKILENTNANHIDSETALEQVLDLFNVSKRFCLCEEPDENWDSGQTCFCGKCDKLVDAC